MKLKGMYKVLMLVVGVIAISFAGCGTKKDTVEKDIPAEALTETPAESASPEEEEGVVDTGDKDVPQTQSGDISGEGMVDGTVPDISGIQEAPVGEPLIFADGGGADFCSLAIESIEVSDIKIENMEDVADKKVVVVNYNFENTSSGEAILIDDMSFKMLANDVVAVPYFSPELATAEQADRGETSSGQLAFLVDSDIKDVVLVFENVSIDDKAIFKATI